MNMYPSICDIYTKNLKQALDDTKRVVTDNYNKSVPSMPLSRQPLSGKTKIELGIEFSKEAFTGYTLTDYDGMFDVGDILKFKGKFYIIKELLSYDEGKLTNHIKFICEILPTKPKGLT